MERITTEDDGCGVRLAKTAQAVFPTVLAGYQVLASKTAPEDPKVFAAFQSACRSALAHLVLLSRLADQAETANPRNADADCGYGTEDLVAAAQDVLSQYDEAAA